MRTTLAVSSFFVTVLVSCGDASSRRGLSAGDDSASRFVDGVQHLFFPITPGDFRTYEGEHGGLPRREEVRTSWQTRVIDRVVCTALEHQVFDTGELVETSTEWFAQDDTGRVWKFGEEAYTVVDGEPSLSADSWLAGVSGARPWVAFPSAMRVGDVIIGYRPEGQERMEVTSITETVTTPAATFTDCLKIVENPDDPDDLDIILYAPGVGRVVEENGDRRERLELVRWSIERRESGTRRDVDVR